jgi:5'-methylthioadenosine phosphorylase
MVVQENRERMARIGIIGGSGLYQMEGLTDIESVKLSTPFGDPSDEYITGMLAGHAVAFLPRHGRGHRILPTEVNNRANIYGMKMLGVERIISVSAVGSLKKELQPTDIVLIDQFFDRTTQARPNTFFGKGIVAHIQFAHPLCPHLRQVLLASGQAMGAPVKWGGTYVNMEGPAFSTLGESQVYRSWGMDVVGMTQMNEARLAREAEICYATMAMVTDYDCWYEAETGHTVSVEVVLQTLNQNVATAREMVRQTILSMPAERSCSCGQALAGAVLTERSAWPKETIDVLGPILQKYV